MENRCTSVRELRPVVVVAAAARMASMAGDRGLVWRFGVWRMSSEKVVRKRIIVAVG